LAKGEKRDGGSGEKKGGAGQGCGRCRAGEKSTKGRVLNNLVEENVTRTLWRVSVERDG